MSSSRNCVMIEIKRDQWFYYVEHVGAPDDAFDWRENASAYGPFPSEDAADAHLCSQHSNPGGVNIVELEQGMTEIDLDQDSVLKALITQATPPRKTAYSPTFR